MTEEKEVFAGRRTLLAIGLLLVIGLCSYAGFYMGAEKACKSSGGTLIMPAFRCVDYSSLEFCRCTEDPTQVRERTPQDLSDLLGQWNESISS